MSARTANQRRPMTEETNQSGSVPRLVRRVEVHSTAEVRHGLVSSREGWVKASDYHKMEDLIERIEAVACGSEQPPEEYLDDTDGLRWIWEQIQNFKPNE